MGGTVDALAATHTIVVIDWPSRDVPDTLARAGFAVHVRGGPRDADFSEFRLENGEIVAHPTGRAPSHADIVYCHRPLAEMPDIAALAARLGAKLIWSQSGLDDTGARDPKGCWAPQADLDAMRAAAESAGLAFISEPYIADAARALHRSI